MQINLKNFYSNPLKDQGGVGIQNIDGIEFQILNIRGAVLQEIVDGLDVSHLYSPVEMKP